MMIQPVMRGVGQVQEGIPVDETVPSQEEEKFSHCKEGAPGQVSLQGCVSEDEIQGVCGRM